MVYFLTAEQVQATERIRPGCNTTMALPQRKERHRSAFVGGTYDICQPYRDRSKRIPVNAWRGSGHGESGVPT